MTFTIDSIYTLAQMVSLGWPVLFLLITCIVALAVEAVTLAAEQHDLLLPGYQTGGQVNE